MAATIQLTDGQSRAVEMARKFARRLDGVCAVVGYAGCHRRGQDILMFDGSVKQVEDVVVGDLLMGPDSRPRQVQRLVRGRGQMVEVVPTKGDPWVVNTDHVLTVDDLRKRRVGPRHLNGVTYWHELRDVTVRELLENGLTAGRGCRTTLIRAAVEFSNPALPPDALDPYFLGALLGDGSIIDSVTLYKPDPEMRALAEDQAAKYGLHVADVDQGSSIGYRLSGKRGQFGYNTGRQHPIAEALRSLGLWGTQCHTKFVPQIYKTSSRDVRAAVLAGLLDTDGSLVVGGYDYISASRQLTADVAYIARSLGLAAYYGHCEKSDQNGTVGTYWRCSISGDCSKLPLRIPRKIASARRQVKSVLRTGFTLNPLLVEEDYFGFTLTGDGRFLLGDFTVTHNCGKTTLVKSLRAAGISPFIVTPTGKAALRVREVTGEPAVTIHSWLYTVKTDEKTGEAEYTLRRAGDLEKRTTGNLIVIDEASMVGPDVWHDVRRAATQLRKSIMLVGDGFQLPPVQPRGAPPFSVLDGAWVQERVALTEIMRQAADSPVIRAATLMRTGRVHDGVAMLPKMTGREETLEHARAGNVFITYSNAVRHKINNGIRQSLGITGRAPQVGEPLLVRKNSPTVERYNGEIVRLISLGTRRGTIFYSESDQRPQALEVVTADVGSDDAEHEVILCLDQVAGLTDKLKEHRIRGAANAWIMKLLLADGLTGVDPDEGDLPGDSVQARVAWLMRTGRVPPFLNANLGYCLTGHTVQGSEWDAVAIRMDYCVRLNEEEGQRWIYTAATRARKAAYLV